MKLLSELDFYYDNNGNVVLTERYLLNRGFCCENGCKHCPYGFNKEIKKKEDNTDKK